MQMHLEENSVAVCITLNQTRLYILLITIIIQMESLHKFGHVLLVYKSIHELFILISRRDPLALQL